MFGRFDVYFTLLLIKIKHILQENVQNERKEEIINFANKFAECVFEGYSSPGY